MKPGVGVDIGTSNIVVARQNEKGEFVSGEEGKTILALAEQEDFIYAPVDAMGELIGDDNSLSKHIQAILDHPLVDIYAIKKAKN